MIDTFGRKITYLRLSVTDLCNLRCRYCMPLGVPKKSHDQMLTQEEMVQAVAVAAELGIQKLRITGGEPLLKKNILSICEALSGINGIEELSMTTNGILLPALAKDLVHCGVERINISLDTLDAKKYRDMTQNGELADALNGLNAALAAGFSKVKINVVLIGGFNDDEIRDFAKLTQEYPVDVRFIELMPMEAARTFPKHAFVSAEAVLETLRGEITLEKTDGVAQLYRMEGARGSIGLIRPVSKMFCATCNRLRLTADGRIKPCLHDGYEIPIKGMDREEMRKAFETAAAFKPEKHGELSCACISRAGRSMNEIGG